MNKTIKDELVNVMNKFNLLPKENKDSEDVILIVAFRDFCGFNHVYSWENFCNRFGKMTYMPSQVDPTMDNISIGLEVYGIMNDSIWKMSRNLFMDALEYHKWKVVIVNDIPTSILRCNSDERKEKLMDYIVQLIDNDSPLAAPPVPNMTINGAAYPSMVYPPNINYAQNTNAVFEQYNQRKRDFSESLIAQAKKDYKTETPGTADIDAPEAEQNDLSHILSKMYL